MFLHFGSRKYRHISLTRQTEASNNWSKKSCLRILLSLHLTLERILYYYLLVNIFWDAMGISSNTKQVVYAVTNLTWDYIANISWRRLCSSFPSDDASHCPIIDIDFSDVLYIVGGKLTKPMEAEAAFTKIDHRVEWSRSCMLFINTTNC